MLHGSGHTPLNQFVTFNFAHTDIGPREVLAAFTKLRTNYFGPWYRRPKKGVPAPKKSAAFMWVQEAARGVHCVHWAVHVPPHRLTDFKKRLAKWLAQVAGNIDKRAIDIRPVTTPGLTLYLGKGVDPMYAAFYGIEPVDQGKTYGKRAGFSQSLGPTACRNGRTYWSQMKQDQCAANDSKQTGAAA